MCIDISRFGYAQEAACESCIIKIQLINLSTFSKVEFWTNLKLHFRFVRNFSAW